METIASSLLYSFADQIPEIGKASNHKIRTEDGLKVSSYLELTERVAELQFFNSEHVLLFRGQDEDYFNLQRNTSLKPSLLRNDSNSKPPSATTLTQRFELLKRAERSLAQIYEQKKLPGRDKVKRYRILRWAVLQHYEVCATPLLDVTHSLRIAASFASAGTGDKAFIFVLGVPNLSGSVTASAESGLQIIRLSSVCPHTALRPHIQEAYLLGEYPDMGDFSQKANYYHHEIDFGRRLVAKFWFDPQEFWGNDTFPKVVDNALCPNGSDPLFTLAQEIKSQLQTDNH
jgi:hypothetical protein